MTVLAMNEIQKGTKVVVDGDPCVVIENVYVKPGKGQAFNRVKTKNLKTGRVVERTFKSNDTLDGADVSDIEADYLYNDGMHWHFMCKESFEQYALSEAQVDEAKQWLKDQTPCMITLWNNEPILVAAPIFVTLAVTETDPGLRGDTSGGGSKPATLETGAVIRVPLFINEGDVLKVDTRTGDYVSRVNK